MRSLCSRRAVEPATRSPRSMRQSLIYICFGLLLPACLQAAETDHLHVLTVGTDDTHGLQRFERSAKIYGITYEVLGRGEEWKGGDMRFPGGGHKVNLLKKRIDEMYHKFNRDMVVMFTDSYDVIFLGEPHEIVKRYRASGHRVLFAAEPFCWPDATLAERYPPAAHNPYLNSGGFIGTLADIWKMLNSMSIDDSEDDQLFYTRLYLDAERRAELDLALDHGAVIFQTLHGALSDVKLHANGTEEWAYLENVATGSRPLVLHGNGPAKLALNALSNYLPRARTPARCHACEERRRALPADAELPRVMLAIFIEQPTPFLEEFLQTVLDIDYPKKKLDLLVRNNVEYHEPEVEAWFARVAQHYAGAERLRPADRVPEHEARRRAIERCAARASCSHVLALDGVARLRAGALRALLASGLDAAAPLLARPGQPWTNFWGALGDDGFYARSPDYMDIVNGKLK